MAECYCFCHRSYDLCDGNCCTRAHEKERKEREFWASEEGKNIELNAHIEVLGYYKVKKETIQKIKKIIKEDGLKK